MKARVEFDNVRSKNRHQITRRDVAVLESEEFDDHKAFQPTRLLTVRPLLAAR